MAVKERIPMVKSDTKPVRVPKAFMQLKQAGEPYAEILLLFHQSIEFEKKANALIKKLKFRETLTDRLNQTTHEGRVERRRISAAFSSGNHSSVMRLILDDISKRILHRGDHIHEHS
jgi:DNA recombination-dependent growth factor C